MAGDIFLAVQTKSGGKVKGEAAAPGHEDEIALSSWHWGVRASSALASGTAQTRSYTALTVVKAIDSATSALMKALIHNDEVKEAVLTMSKSGGDKLDYFFIKLQHARVTQVEHACSESGDAQETVSFAFRTVQVEYRSQQSGGGRGASCMFNDSLLQAKS